jgi:flagellar protein FlgJ
MDPITGLSASLSTPLGATPVAPSTSAAATPAANAAASVSGTPADKELTPVEKQALAKLHTAAQQLESLFVNLLFKEMRKSAPPTSFTGKPSNADNIYADMLDEKRAESLSQTGSLGIGKLIEQELRAKTIADADAAAKTRVPTETDL